MLHGFKNTVIGFSAPPIRTECPSDLSFLEDLKIDLWRVDITDPASLTRSMDGVDLVPFATGDAQGVPHEALFWRSGASQSALVNGWKLNLSDPPGRYWLFDMSADPVERHDLARERPEKLAELQAALAAHNAEQASPAWPARLSSPINIDKDLTQPDSPDDEYIYWSN